MCICPRLSNFSIHLHTAIHAENILSATLSLCTFLPISLFLSTHTRPSTGGFMQHSAFQVAKITLSYSSKWSGHICVIWETIFFKLEIGNVLLTKPNICLSFSSWWTPSYTCSRRVDWLGGSLSRSAVLTTSARSWLTASWVEVNSSTYSGTSLVDVWKGEGEEKIE